MSQQYLDEIEVDGESYLIRDTDTHNKVMSEIARAQNVEEQLQSGKQNTISDLVSIRSGAAKGTTSVQGIQLNDDPVAQPTNGKVVLQFKTINNQPITGTGNIIISGGGGEVSPELEAQVNENTANIAQNTSDIEKLMKKNFPLVVSFSISPSALQEYGETVDTVTANWSIDGADVEVLGVELQLGSAGGWIDVTDKTSHTFSNAGITTNTTVYFTAEISGEDIVNKSASINFAYAAYMGVVVADWAVSETNVKSLTKQSLSTSKSRNYTTSSALNLQKIVYAYAQTYGAISKVLDGNGFDVTDSFEQKTATINNVAYYIYISKEATTTDAKVTVKFS